VNKESAHTESQQYQEQREKGLVMAKDSLVSSTAENVLENAFSSKQLGLNPSSWFLRSDDRRKIQEKIILFLNCKRNSFFIWNAPLV